MNDLRLFPLQTVLFPGQTLALVVFEPRYHQLVRECLEADEPFGVVLIREGVEVAGPAVPHAVGTTARIISAQPMPDGRLQITARGERRFRIVRLHEDRPYLRAEVDYPADEASNVPDDLVRRARAAYGAVLRLRQMARGEYQRDTSGPESPSALADAIGDLRPGSNADLQRVLGSDEVRVRLQRGTELLERAIEGAHREATRAVADRYQSEARLN